MQDRMNYIENLLVTELGDESDITDEFELVHRGFREDLYNYYEHELPSLAVESIEVEDGDLVAGDGRSVFESIVLILEINCRSAELADARQKVKELLSLVRDFLKSTSWSREKDTRVGRSGFATFADKSYGFRATGTVEAVVSVNVAEVV